MCSKMLSEDLCHMLRSATYAPLAIQNIYPPNHVLDLSEAGFILIDMTRIRCEGCRKCHMIQTVTNSPGTLEYHEYGCQFLSDNNCENPDYSTYEGRLRSFDNVELPYPLEASNLAAYFYYFSGPGFVLVCYFCRIRIRPAGNFQQLNREITGRRFMACLCIQRTQSLSNNDTELSEQVEDVQLISDPAAQQLPVHETDQANDDHSTFNYILPVDTLLQSVSISEDVNNIPDNKPTNSESVCEQRGGTPNSSHLHPPSYPEHLTYQKRLDSFANWSKSEVHQPTELASSGFFYAGYDDCVRCFQCGVGLKSWKLGDDIKTEHTRFRPNCPFLKSQQNIGETFEAVIDTELSEQVEDIQLTSDPSVQQLSMQETDQANDDYSTFNYTPTVETLFQSVSISGDVNNIPDNELTNTGNEINRRDANLLRIRGGTQQEDAHQERRHDDSS